MILLTIGLLCTSLFSNDSSSVVFEERQWWQVSRTLEHADDPLYPYYVEAVKRGLPTRLFLDLFEEDSFTKYVRSTSKHPHFVKSSNVFGTYATIYLKVNSQNPEKWFNNQWGDFYNELFHMWFEFVFKNSHHYRQDLAHLQNKLARYKDVSNSGDLELVQEEAFSETLSNLIVNFFRKFPKVDPESGKILRWHFYSKNKFAYKKHFTIIDTCHSENPEYNCDKGVYLSKDEYRLLLELVTN